MRNPEPPINLLYNVDNDQPDSDDAHVDKSTPKPPRGESDGSENSHFPLFPVSFLFGDVAAKLNSAVKEVKRQAEEGCQLIEAEFDEAASSLFLPANSDPGATVNYAVSQPEEQEDTVRCEEPYSGISNIVSSVAGKLSSFWEENQLHLAQEQAKFALREEELSPTAALWHISAPELKPLEVELKTRIMKVSRDEATFSGDPPPNLSANSSQPFHLEKYLGLAATSLIEDPKLLKVRYRMVPLYMTEDEFWCRYFAAAAKIKLEVLEERGKQAVVQYQSGETDADREAIKNGMVDDFRYVHHGHAREADDIATAISVEEWHQLCSSELGQLGVLFLEGFSDDKLYKDDSMWVVPYDDKEAWELVDMKNMSSPPTPQESPVSQRRVLHAVEAN